MSKIVHLINNTHCLGMMVPHLGHHRNTLTHIDLLNNIFVMPHLGIMAPHLPR